MLNRNESQRIVTWFWLGPLLETKKESHALNEEQVYYFQYFFCSCRVQPKARWGRRPPGRWRNASDSGGGGGSQTSTGNRVALARRQHHAQRNGGDQIRNRRHCAGY